MGWAFANSAHGGPRWIALIPKPAPAVDSDETRWRDSSAPVRRGARYVYRAPSECPTVSPRTFKRAIADLIEQGALILVPIARSSPGPLAWGYTTPELWAEFRASQVEMARGRASALHITGALARWGIEVVTTGGEGAGSPVAIQVKGAESLDTLAGLIARLQH